MKFYGWKLLHTENISQNVKPWYEKSLLPNWNSGSDLFLESSYLKVRNLSGISFCETISTKLIFAANREIKFFERHWDRLNRKNLFHKVLFFGFCVSCCYGWAAAQYTAWKVSVFGVFLIRIFRYSDWIQTRKTPYFSVFSPNAGKYAAE